MSIPCYHYDRFELHSHTDAGHTFNLFMSQRTFVHMSVSGGDCVCFCSKPALKVSSVCHESLIYSCIFLWSAGIFLKWTQLAKCFEQRCSCAASADGLSRVLLLMFMYVALDCGYLRKDAAWSWIWCFYCLLLLDLFQNPESSFALSQTCLSILCGTARVLKNVVNGMTCIIFFVMVTVGCWHCWSVTVFGRSHWLARGVSAVHLRPAAAFIILAAPHRWTCFPRVHCWSQTPSFSDFSLISHVLSSRRRDRGKLSQALSLSSFRGFDCPDTWMLVFLSSSDCLWWFQTPLLWIQKFAMYFSVFWVIFIKGLIQLRLIILHTHCRVWKMLIIWPK